MNSVEYVCGMCSMYVCVCVSHLAFVGFPDDSRADEVPRGLPLGLLLFGLALEGQRLLELLGDLKPVEAARLSLHRLPGGKREHECVAKSLVFSGLQHI